VLCPLKALDKSANADGQRRRLAPVTTPALAPPSTGIAPLLRQLLAAAAQRELPQLDEKLYLEVFVSTETPSRRRVAPGR